MIWLSIGIGVVAFGMGLLFWDALRWLSHVLDLDEHDGYRSEP